MKIVDPSLSEAALAATLKEAIRKQQELMNDSEVAVDSIGETAFAEAGQGRALSAWSTEYRGVGGLVVTPDGCRCASISPEASESLFSLLNALDVGPVPTGGLPAAAGALRGPLQLLMRQLKEGTRTTENSGNVLRAVQQYTHFQSLLAARKDPEVAWLAYRLLQWYLRSALQGALGMFVSRSSAAQNLHGVMAAVRASAAFSALTRGMPPPVASDVDLSAATSSRTSTGGPLWDIQRRDGGASSEGGRSCMSPQGRDTGATNGDLSKEQTVTDVGPPKGVPLPPGLNESMALNPSDRIRDDLPLEGSAEPSNAAHHAESAA
eukprot:jgi/Botrbrau1/4237/Bobra.0044s0032.1